MDKKREATKHGGYRSWREYLVLDCDRVVKGNVDFVTVSSRRCCLQLPPSPPTPLTFSRLRNFALRRRRLQTPVSTTLKNKQSFLCLALGLSPRTLTRWRHFLCTLCRDINARTLIRTQCRPSIIFGFAIFRVNVSFRRLPPEFVGP